MLNTAASFMEIRSVSRGIAAGQTYLTRFPHDRTTITISSGECHYRRNVYRVFSIPGFIIFAKNIFSPRVELLAEPLRDHLSSSFSSATCNRDIPENQFARHSPWVLPFRLLAAGDVPRVLPPSRFSCTFPALSFNLALPSHLGHEAYVLLLPFSWNSRRSRQRRGRHRLRGRFAFRLSVAWKSC